MTPTKDSLFKPSKAEAKGDLTTRTARAIIDQEIAQRDEKTAKLRAMRLAKEAEERAEAARAPAPELKRAGKRPARPRG